MSQSRSPQPSQAGRWRPASRCPLVPSQQLGRAAMLFGRRRKWVTMMPSFASLGRRRTGTRLGPPQWRRAITRPPPTTCSSASRPGHTSACSCGRWCAPGSRHSQCAGRRHSHWKGRSIAGGLGSRNSTCRAPAAPRFECKPVTASLRYPSLCPTRPRRHLRRRLHRHLRRGCGEHCGHRHPPPDRPPIPPAPPPLPPLPQFPPHPRSKQPAYHRRRR